MSAPSGGPYPMAPLIRFTLVSLYLALVLPLPWLVAEAPTGLLATAVLAGLLLVLAATSERVEIDASGIRVGHPGWCSWLLRRGWSLPWQAVTGLSAIGTSQGGRVFYLRSASGAFLVPQRVARFDQFLEELAGYSGLDISSIGRISPPWTYQLLAILSGSMLLGELAWGLFALQG
jgi:hypothetical protein